MIPHAPFRVRRRNSQESVRNGRRYRVNRREWRVVCDRIPPAGDTLGIPVSSVIRIAMRRFLQFFRGAGRTSPEELLHAARVLLWVRWLGLIAALVEIHYRVDYGSLSHILNTFYCLGFLAANGYVQWLIRRRWTVKPSWLLGLSALDLAVISFSTSLSGGFNSPYFPAYYFAVAVFAYVFTAPRLVLPWTTLVAAIYSVLSFTVEPTLDLPPRRSSTSSTGWWPCTPSPRRSASSPGWSGKAGEGGWSGSCSASASSSPEHPRHHRPVGLHDRPGRRGGDGAGG